MIQTSINIIDAIKEEYKCPQLKYQTARAWRDEINKLKLDDADE